jgi:pyridoxamine 5'-phosphate oxidase
MPDTSPSADTPQASDDPPGLLPAHAGDLDAVLAEAFRQFSRGVADRRSAFHTPTIVTVAADGAPRARTMVLRRFDPVRRQLTLYTDRRSGKLDDIARTPRAAVHVHDARAAVQVRLSAAARIHVDDAVARDAWTAGAPRSLACYAADPAPGTEVAAPPPAPDGEAGGYRNFAVLALTFDSLEWLWLFRGGHRRARFTWAADGARHATWLAP